MFIDTEQIAGRDLGLRVLLSQNEPEPFGMFANEGFLQVFGQGFEILH
jgi:hypothetical protein